MGKVDLPDMTEEESEALANLDNFIIPEEDREEIALTCLSYQIRCQIREAMSRYHG